MDVEKAFTLDHIAHRMKVARKDAHATLSMACQGIGGRVEFKSSPVVRAVLEEVEFQGVSEFPGSPKNRGARAIGSNNRFHT